MGRDNIITLAKSRAKNSALTHRDLYEVVVAKKILEIALHWMRSHAPKPRVQLSYVFHVVVIKCETHFFFGIAVRYLPNTKAKDWHLIVVV
jgi:hypothetical protein